MIKKSGMTSLLFAATLLCAVSAQEGFFPEKQGGWTPALNADRGICSVTKKTPTLLSVFAFKVDQASSYELSGKFRSDKSAPLKKRLFFGAEAYTEANRVIGSPQVNIYVGTETVLAKALKRGDRVVYVRDASCWNKKNGAAVIAFRIKDKLADLPNNTFSSGMAKIEKLPSMWAIHLKRPSVYAFPAGTPVRQHAHSIGRNYFAANSRWVTSGEWVEFKGTISGIAPHGAVLRQWWKGTTYARIILQASPGVQFKDIVLRKVGGKVELLPIFSGKKSAGKSAVKKNSKVNSTQKILEAKTEKYLKEVTCAIPRKHPRLMYSPQILDRMKRAYSDPVRIPYLRRMEKKVSDTYHKLLDTLSKDDGLGKKEPAGRRYHPLREWGATAGSAAILYRVKGEKKWAEMSIDLLKKLTPWYNRRFQLGRSVSWYGFSRVMAILAWDWLYDVMTPADRDAIAKEMISHCKKLADTPLIRKLNPNGEGFNGPASGFYSARCMVPWYAGIAYHGEGYDDTFIRKSLEEGLKGHLEMLSTRNNMAGDDGGSTNSSPGYCYGTYNNVEFWFFISWNSLTSRNIASDFPAMGLFPFWLTYTIFRGIDGLPYDFGTGGAWHTDNVFMAPLCYHSLFRNFYSGAVCDLSDAIQKARPILGWNRFDWMLYEHPFYIFFDKTNPKPEMDPAFYEKLPKGYFFENLGQTYMHSGWTGKDTHAMFTCGSKSPSHKEHDENHFVIYKGGFLALDSGARTTDFTAKGRELYYAHDSNYRATSIAHNVILIRMEEEKFGGWRIAPEKVGNHESMKNRLGGIVRAFETNKDFTYIAGDSTACYNPGKARQVVRQFLMIYPDLFVIYDRVRSVKADQKKTWQLHTQEEPLIKGSSFEVVQREGRLICRTLLPEKARLVKIGGPGKEFWSDGKNYPLGPHLEKYVAASRKRGHDAPLWGAWRMFITDPEAKTDNTFLHVMQVGLKKEFTEMIPTRLVREKGMEGAAFTYNGVDYTVLFDPSRVPAGRIKAVKNNKVLYDRAFTQTVQKQRAMDYLK